MGAQYGGVSSEVVKVVHDDRHEQVQHDERAEEDEGDKVDVRHVRSTGLFRIQKGPGGFVPLIGIDITRSAWQSIQHDVWPSFTSGAPWDDGLV